jgi:hypothetical protein
VLCCAALALLLLLLLLRNRVRSGAAAAAGRCRVGECEALLLLQVAPSCRPGRSRVLLDASWRAHFAGWKPVGREILAPKLKAALAPASRACGCCCCLIAQTPILRCLALCGVRGNALAACLPSTQLFASRV